MLIPNVSSVLPTSQPVRLPGEGAPKVAVATAKTVPQEPTAQQLKTAVNNINQAMQKASMSMELSIDSSTKKPVVKMMDAETGELIRQFPSEEVLAIASSIDQFLEFQQGLLLKAKA